MASNPCGVVVIDVLSDNHRTASVKVAIIYVLETNDIVGGRGMCRELHRCMLGIWHRGQRSPLDRTVLNLVTSQVERAAQLLFAHLHQLLPVQLQAHCFSHRPTITHVSEEKPTHLLRAPVSQSRREWSGVSNRSCGLPVCEIFGRVWRRKLLRFGRVTLLGARGYCRRDRRF